MKKIPNKSDKLCRVFTIIPRSNFFDLVLRVKSHNFDFEVLLGRKMLFVRTHKQHFIHPSSSSGVISREVQKSA